MMRVIGVVKRVEKKQVIMMIDFLTVFACSGHDGGHMFSCPLVDAVFSCPLVDIFVITLHVCPDQLGR